jgi:hypothetical protein
MMAKKLTHSGPFMASTGKERIYTLAGRRVPRGMHSDDARTGPRAARPPPGTFVRRAH